MIADLTVLGRRGIGRGREGDERTERDDEGDSAQGKETKGSVEEGHDDRIYPAGIRLTPADQSTNRRSTSRKTAGCSECTQWPASLIVTRRTRGKNRSIATA